MIAAFMQDVRYAIRQLRKSPGFAAVALLTLAAGIASTCVVFSIVDAVLLRPLSFPDPERLVAVDVTFRPSAGDGAAVSEPDISYLNFADWREQAKSFASLSATKVDGFTLTDRAGGPSQRVQGGVVTGEFFNTLGVSPVLGRGFLRDEERPGNRSVVIGNALCLGSMFVSAMKTTPSSV
jgi:putative ABC transport system permease protein